MRIKPPAKGIDFKTKDVHGEPFQLSQYRGKRVALSFFRDAACPFCNYRVYELTHKYHEWQEAGMEVVIVFSDTAKQVRKHIARHPRPFHMICDPKLKLYERYGVEKSWGALLKTLVLGLPETIRGIAKGGRPTNNPHMNLVPADFLIDSDGQIVDAWYGTNMADHIPIDRLQDFAATAPRSRRALEEELEQLRAENKRLKEPRF